MPKFALSAFALLSLAVAGGAHAGDVEPVRVAVPYSDLDLTTAAGAATMQARVETALKSVCYRPVTREMKAIAEWQKCRTDARESAAAQIDRAGLPVQIAAR